MYFGSKEEYEKIKKYGNNGITHITIDNDALRKLFDTNHEWYEPRYVNDSEMFQGRRKYENFNKLKITFRNLLWEDILKEDNE